MKPKPSHSQVILLAAAVTACCIFACARSDGDFVNALGRSAHAAKNKPEATLTISSLTDFQWDRLIIFGPYTPIDKIHNQLGYKWRGADRTGIELSDTFYLLVFTKNGKVVRDFKFPRAIGDFQGLKTGNTFFIGDDSFEVTSSAAGDNKRINLFPKRKGEGQPGSK